MTSTPNSDLGDVLWDGDHFVNGILYPEAVLREEEYKKVLDFPLQSDDTFVTSYPKSGTIWTVGQVKLIKEKVQELSGSISGDTVPLSKMHMADCASWPEEDGKEFGMVSDTYSSSNSSSIIEHGSKTKWCTLITSIINQHTQLEIEQSSISGNMLLTRSK